MLSLSFRSDAEYLTRYAAEHGEPPGQWLGAGAEALGLTGGVEDDTMVWLYGCLIHPVTGEPLEVRKSQAEARNYCDATFSAAKSWSVLWAGLETEGRHDQAEQLWSAWMDGARAGIEYLQQHAGYSRAVARSIRARDWVMSTWRHHSDREENPQLHVHVAILNRVQCEDGVWRSLDGQAITRARPAAGAIAERVAEESATRRLGISFAMRRDGKAREIVGVDQALIDTFLSRQSGSKR